MNFIIDNQLPRALARWIALQPNCAANHVRDLGMPQAADGVIAELAEQDGLIVVTKDEDFLRLRHPDRYAMIWIRSGNAINSKLRALVEREWESVMTRLASGVRLIEVR